MPDRYSLAKFNRYDLSSREALSRLDIEDIELDALLQIIDQCYGYDFKDYARASLKRRVGHRLSVEKCLHISELIPLVVHNKSIFGRLLSDLSIGVTEMFRDPVFFNSVTRQVFPLLKTFPFFKIWHAGCSTGEEVYSLAILLEEAGLLDQARIYATDINKVSLCSAKEGIYRERAIDQLAAQYLAAGGKHRLKDYFHCKYGSVKILEKLKRRITFARHNLVCDGVFGDMQLVICRNVLIYFNKALKQRAVQLFYDSLCTGGILCIGNKESLDFLNIGGQFECRNPAQRIYQKRPHNDNNLDNHVFTQAMD
jgi:chemotaxis protein methyltransferase CheR